MKKSLQLSTMFLLSFFLLFSVNLNSQIRIQKSETPTVRGDISHFKKDKPTRFVKDLELSSSTDNSKLSSVIRDAKAGEEVLFGGSPWYLNGNAPSPYAIYSFATTNDDVTYQPTSLTRESPGNDLFSLFSGTYANGKYYAFDFEQYVTVYNTSNWEVIEEKSVATGQNIYIKDYPDFIAYDPTTTSTAYGIGVAQNADNSLAYLFIKYDLDALEGEELGTFPFPVSFLVFHPSGQLIVAATSGMFYFMDKETGEMEEWLLLFENHTQVKDYMPSEDPGAHGAAISGNVMIWSGPAYVNYKPGSGNQDGYYASNLKFYFSEDGVTYGTAFSSPSFMANGVFAIDEAFSGGSSIAGNKVKENDNNVYSSNGNIIIEEVNGENVTIFTIDGKQVYNKVVNEDVIPVAAGVYVVRVGNSVSKVMVK